MLGKTLKLAAGICGVFVASHALLGAALVAVDKLKSALRDEEDRDYPWLEIPEIELQDGEYAKLYTNGVRLYEAMLAEIENARSYIFIGSFIWHSDEAGEAFAEALRRKAREGVAVYAVFDTLGNAMVGSPTEGLPEGVHGLHFRQLPGRDHPPTPRSVSRYHRHEMSVDGRVSFVGGYNIGSLYARSWRDTHISVRGAAVDQLEDAFAEFWNLHRTQQSPRIQRQDDLRRSPSTTLHCNQPRRGSFPIRSMYLEAIARATSRVYLTQGYFIPTRPLRRTMIGAAGRGVDVRVLLPEKSNHVMVDWLGRRHFDELLRGGVRIFAYKNFMHHAKTATIDGRWSTVGTANLNRQGLSIHHEANLEIHDESVAAQMEEVFAHDLTNAAEITLHEWRKRPLVQKLIERALDTLRPLV